MVGKGNSNCARTKGQQAGVRCAASPTATRPPLERSFFRVHPLASFFFALAQNSKACTPAAAISPPATPWHWSLPVLATAAWRAAAPNRARGGMPIRTRHLHLPPRRPKGRRRPVLSCIRRPPPTRARALSSPRARSPGEHARVHVRVGIEARAGAAPVIRGRPRPRRARRGDRPPGPPGPAGGAS